MELITSHPLYGKVKNMEFEELYKMLIEERENPNKTPESIVKMQVLKHGISINPPKWEASIIKIGTDMKSNSWNRNYVAFQLIKIEDYKHNGIDCYKLTTWNSKHYEFNEIIIDRIDSSHLGYEHREVYINIPVNSQLIGAREHFIFAKSLLHINY
jgi:hypothetical protein